MTVIRESWPGVIFLLKNLDVMCSSAVGCQICHKVRHVAGIVLSVDARVVNEHDSFHYERVAEDSGVDVLDFVVAPAKELKFRIVDEQIFWKFC